MLLLINLKDWNCLRIYLKDWFENYSKNKGPFCHFSAFGLWISNKPKSFLVQSLYMFGWQQTEGFQIQTQTPPIFQYMTAEFILSKVDWTTTRTSQLSPNIAICQFPVLGSSFLYWFLDPFLILWLNMHSRKIQDLKSIGSK